MPTFTFNWAKPYIPWTSAATRSFIPFADVITPE